jgi:hypothetical protein
MFWLQRPRFGIYSARCDIGECPVSMVSLQNIYSCNAVVVAVGDRRYQMLAAGSEPGRSDVQASLAGRGNNDGASLRSPGGRS